MPLFVRNQTVDLRFKGKQITGQLVYEKTRDLAIRTVPFSEGRAVQTGLLEQLRDTWLRDRVQAEYWRGSYLCTFETRMIGVEPDLSCEEGSIIVSLEVPGRVRRTLKADRSTE